MISDSKQHILILGVTGFIGSAFFKELKLTSKKAHFHLLIRTKESNLINTPNCTVYYGDLETFDWSKLKSTPDFVYHFARLNSTKWRKIGRMLATINGKKANKRLLAYLNKFAPSSKLYYLSGSLMYGNSTAPIVEGNKLNPISFAKQYHIAEKPFIKNQNLNNSVQICLVRVPWVLGNGSWFNGFYKNYITTNNLVPVYGKGDNMMSFITLTELAKHLVELMTLDFHKSIHISYSKFISQFEFAKLVSKNRNLELKKVDLQHFEKAIIEAFTSQIMLTSEIRELKVTPSELNDKLNSELFLIFKDI